MLYLLAGVVAAAFADRGHPGESAARSLAEGLVLIGPAPGAVAAIGALPAVSKNIALAAGPAAPAVIDAVGGRVAAGIRGAAALAVAVVRGIDADQHMFAGIIAATGRGRHLAADAPGEAAGSAIGGAVIGILPGAAEAVGVLAREGMTLPAVPAGAFMVHAGRIGQAAGIGSGAGAAGAAAGASGAGELVLVGIIATACRGRHIAAHIPTIAAGDAIGRGVVGILPGAAEAIGVLAREHVTLPRIPAEPAFIYTIRIGQAAGILVTPGAATAAGGTGDAGPLELTGVIAAAGAQGRLAADVPGQAAPRAVALGRVGIGQLILAGAAGAALQVEFATRAGSLAHIGAAIIQHPAAIGAQASIAAVGTVRSGIATVIERPVVGALGGAGAPGAGAVIVNLAAAGLAIAVLAAAAAILGQAPGVVAPAEEAAHLGAGRLVGAEAGVVGGHAVAVIELAVVAEDRAQGGAAVQHAGIVAAASSRARALLLVLSRIVAATLVLGRIFQPLVVAVARLAVGLGVVGAVPDAAAAEGLGAAKGVAGVAVLAGAGVIDTVRRLVAAGRSVGAAVAVGGAVAAALGILVGVVAAALGRVRHLAADIPGIAAGGAEAGLVVGILPGAGGAVGIPAGEEETAARIPAGAGIADAVLVGGAAGVGRAARPAGPAAGPGIADAPVFAGVVAAAGRGRRLAADIPEIPAGRAIPELVIGVLPGAAVAKGAPAVEEVALPRVGAGAGLINAIGGGGATGIGGGAGSAGSAR